MHIFLIRGRVDLFRAVRQRVRFQMMVQKLWLEPSCFLVLPSGPDPLCGPHDFTGKARWRPLKTWGRWVAVRRVSCLRKCRWETETLSKERILCLGFLDAFLAKGSCQQSLSACLLVCDMDEPLLCTVKICPWYSPYSSSQSSESNFSDFLDIWY